MERMLRSSWEDDIRRNIEAENKAKGIAEGIVEGEDKLSKLVTLLLEKNDIDSIRKVTKDASFRKQLYKEYGIN